MDQPERSIRLRGHARSDRGQVRQNNEDSIHLWDDENSILAVVADGMGGAVAGEEASRIAVETIRDLFNTEEHRHPTAYAQYDEEELGNMLGHAVRQANYNILHRAKSSPEMKGMGTTLTLAFARDASVVLAHVGDSRAYYIDGGDGSIQQLTTDHTFVQALLNTNHITEAEAAEHPMRNVLYRALGQTDDLDVDVIDGVYLYSGDRIVVCSDGLTLHVTEDEIADAALDSQDPYEITTQLIDLANSRGGKDNVSVVVITAEDHSTVSSMRETEANATPYDPSSDPYKTKPQKPDYMAFSRAKSSIPSNRSPATSSAKPNSTHGEGHDALIPLQ